MSAFPWDLFVSAMVTLLVVIDPPGAAPIFASLTTNASPEQRRAMAWRSILVAAAILFGFAAVGEPFLRALGITLDAFRIAGGIMLFLIALEMVFEKRTQRREDRAQKLKETPEIEDVSIFPMAMPMIAGPGSISAIMLMTARSHGIEATLTVLAAMVSVMALTLFALLLAAPIMKVVGPRIELVITRLLGVILAALAAQFVIDGLKASFA